MDQATEPLLLHFSDVQEVSLLLQSPSEEHGACDPAAFGASLRFIFAGHFLARWGAGMWDFFVALFMITVMPGSLVATAAYGLTETLSVAALGVLVGNWVDKASNLKVLRLSLLVRNGSILAATCFMLFLLLRPVGASNVPVFVALVSFSGASGALAGLGSSILLERDWVVTIAGKNTGLLVEMNTVMRRIDLACKLLAPVFVGGLMSIVSVLACVVLISVWNLVTLVIEYWLLSSAYTALPELHCTTPPAVEEAAETEEPEKSFLQRIPVVEWFSVYLTQECLLAGLALALLYFTVLSFGSLMTANLKWRGVPPYIIGLSRGISALVGVAATFMYPRMYRLLQEVRTGLWSIWMQWSCLLLCVASIWVPMPLLSLAMLMAGVVISRLGLWMFDLAVTQLMQSAVAEHERGVVGGVQNSLQSLMDMLSFVMAIAVSHPQDFWFLMLLSFSAVTAAALLYSGYTYRVRGHLFHPEKLSGCLGLS